MTLEQRQRSDASPATPIWLARMAPLPPSLFMPQCPALDEIYVFGRPMAASLPLSPRDRRGRRFPISIPSLVVVAVGNRRWFLRGHRGTSRSLQYEYFPSLGPRCMTVRVRMALQSKPYVQRSTP